jgi:hypothetical protein
MAELRRLQREATDAYVDCPRLVAHHPALVPPPDPTALRTLTEQIAVVEAGVARGAWQAASADLAAWMAAADAHGAIARRAAATNGGPVRRRAAILGRMEARKGQALFRGLSEQPTLVALNQAAKEVLRTKPMDLDAADAAVAAYEAELRRLREAPRAARS